MEQSGAGEVRRAQYTIYGNIGCCLGWVAINVVVAEILGKPRLLGLAAAAFAMMVCWAVALWDLKAGRVARGVLNYVTTGLLLLLAMGLVVPEMSVLFVFATFIFLAFGLAYAEARATAWIVALTLVVASAMLFTRLVLGWTSGIDPTLLGWVNVIGMTMALAIDATSFVALRKTLQARGERLARAERRYHLLLESARDAIAVLDTSGAILEANRGWEEMLGVARGELTGRNVAELAPTWELARDRATQARVTRKDGKVISVELSTTEIDVHGERCVLAIGRDVTERERLEEQLRQAQKMETVGRLAGGISHDFNNVLSIILSYTELLLADAKLADPARDYLTEVRAAAQGAANLTRQLLMFSRQQVTEPRVLDLNDVLVSMENMLRRLVGEDIELAMIMGEPLDRVRVDRGNTEQVVMNLVANARDAMPTGGKLTIETANVDVDGPHVRLSVTDTGAGMDAATRARIFEPFFTTKDRTKGTGLGLATVFGIVKQSGGTISVRSEPGKGARFEIVLPSVDAAGDVKPPNAGANAHRRRDASHERARAR